MWRLRQPAFRRLSRDAVFDQTRQLVALLAVAVLVINVGSLFHGSFWTVGEYRFVSDTLAGADRAQGGMVGNRFADSWLGYLPVPLPKDYVLGIDLTKLDLERGFWSYLRGEHRWGGWWYYYLYALAVKVPLGMWVLEVVACVSGFVCRSCGESRRSDFVLLAHAGAILVLVSSQMGFNHHLRYVLPAFPFAFVWISQAARVCDVRRRLASSIVPGGIVWSVGSSLWHFPYSLSYFNELAGGPSRGAEHLLHSNLDWGQDLLYLKQWLDKHPEARPIHLACFGVVDPRLAGIEFELPPELPERHARLPPDQREHFGPQPGWYAVSANLLHGYRYSVMVGPTGKLVGVQEPRYTYFRHFQPVAHAGYSISIYHLSLEEVNRVREELRLPPLPLRGGEARAHDMLRAT